MTSSLGAGRDPRRRGHGLRRADDGREGRPGARRAALRLVHGQARLFQGAGLVSLRLELADHGDPEGAEDPDLPSRRGPAPAARRGRPPREEEAALGATRRPVLVSLAIRPRRSPMLRATLLGTGSPPPNPRRRGPATLLSLDDERFLVDAGSGVGAQLVQRSEEHTSELQSQSN